MPSPPLPVDRRGEHGFSLAELLITLLIVVEILVGVLLLFDFNNKLTRVQTHVTDMQQSQRVAQYDMIRLIRMAGRGGMPISPPPPPPGSPAASPRVFPGLALGVADNVAVGTRIAPSAATSPRVVAGTDVLTLRGVFTTPLYQVNFADATSFSTRVASGSVVGQVRVDALSNTGVAQDLEPLLDAIAAGRPEALVIVSPVSDAVYAVVELDPAGSTGTAATGVTVAFKTAGDPFASAYQSISAGGVFPPAFRTHQVARIGILEEYRFYVREAFSVPGDATSEPAPRLARLRVYPGSDTPHAASFDDASVDIADEVVDLQVAVGFDSPNLGAIDDDSDGDGQDDQIAESADGTGDDWLFNALADDATAVGTLPTGGSWTWTEEIPYYVRLSTLVRTERPERGYQAPVIDKIEDRAYGPGDTANTARERMYRRRVLSTVVDLRNFG